MTTEVRFIVLPVPPSANRYWRKGQHGALLRGAGAKLYIEHVRAILPRMPFSLIPKAKLWVRMIWVRDRKSGDLDNRLKIVLDALKGIAFADDNQIVRLEAELVDKMYPKQEGFVFLMIQTPA